MLVVCFRDPTTLEILDNVSREEEHIVKAIGASLYTIIWCGSFDFLFFNRLSSDVK